MRVLRTCFDCDRREAKGGEVMRHGRDLDLPRPTPVHRERAPRPRHSVVRVRLTCTATPEEREAAEKAVLRWLTGPR